MCGRRFFKVRPAAIPGVGGLTGVWPAMPGVGGLTGVRQAIPGVGGLTGVRQAIPGVGGLTGVRQAVPGAGSLFEARHVRFQSCGPRYWELPKPMISMKIGPRKNSPMAYPTP